MNQLTKKALPQPLKTYIFSPKRAVFLGICAVIFTTYLAVNLKTDKIYAATGINRTINFQGKVVNKDGTNVADGQYTFVFKLYDAASGGANPWTETQNNVQVTAGVFRVSLGSVTTFASANVDFNTDNLYLGINFSSDGEMTPRIRFAAVPYAINAQRVAGLTVTDTTGTLTIPNAKTVQFGGAFTTSAQDLTLTLSGTTTLTLPTTGTLATLGGIESLSNKTFTTSIVTSGVTTDLTTVSNEDFSIVPNGTGKVLINTTTGLASFDVRQNAQNGGTIAVASVSGRTSFAALVADNSGLGDLFTASASGATRFRIASNGSIYGPTWEIQATGSANMNAWEGGGLSSDCSATSSKLQWDASTKKFECTTEIAGGTPGSDVQVASVDLGNVTITNAATYLNTVTVTPSSTTGDVIVRANLWTRSLSATDQTITVQIRVASGVTCNGTLLASGTGVLNSAANANGPSAFAIYLEPNPGITAKNYAVCGLTTVVSGAAAGGLASAEVIDSGTSDGASDFNLINGALTPKLIMPDFLWGGTTTNSAAFRLIGNTAFSGVLPVASISANTSNAAIVIDNKGVGDLLTASTGGLTRFTIAQNGTASSSAGFTVNGQGTIQSTRSQTLTVGGGTTGDLVLGRVNQRVSLPGFDCSAQGGGGKLTTTAGGILTCSSDNGGANLWQLAQNGTLAPGNLTVDTLFGGTSTASAVFRISGSLNTGTMPAASVSANTSFAAFVIDNKGVGDLFAASTAGITRFTIAQNGTASSSGGLTLNSQGMIQSTKGQTLTVGGGTTGDLVLGKVAQRAIFPGFDCSAQGNGGKLTTTAGGILTCSSDSGGYSPFQQSSGSIFANNSTLDVLLGGSASISAVLKITGQGNPFAGTLVGASVSANTSFAAFVIDNKGVGDLFAASTAGITRFTIAQNGTASSSGGLTLNSQGMIQSTKGQTLTVGGGTTGDLVLGKASQRTVLSGFDCSAQSNGGKLTTTAGGILTCSADSGGYSPFQQATGSIFANNSTLDVLLGGNSSTSAVMKITGQGNPFAGTLVGASVSANTSFAAFVIDNKGVGDLFTASTSGLTRFVIGQNGTASSSGGFVINGAGALQTTRGQTLTIGGSTTGDIQFMPGNASTSLYLASNGSIRFNGTAGNAQDCLVSSGSSSAPVWGSCLTGTAGNFWNLNAAQGSIYSINTTLDLLWGGTTTASAGFRVAGATKNYGTIAAASVSANTSFAGFVIDNRGSGALLTASSSGQTRFVVSQNGNVGINDSTPTEALDVGGNIAIGAQTNSSLANQQTFTKITDAVAGTITSGGTSAIASISASAVFQGSLYVGTHKTTGGAEVWRYNGTGSSWTKVSQTTAGTIAASGTSGIASISAMTVFNGNLYVGTSKVNEAEVYRYDGGTNWTRVNSAAGTISGTTAVDGISSLAVFGGSLYAGSRENAKADLYVYNGGTTWSVINATPGSFVTTNTVNVDAISAMVVKNGFLYLGVSRGIDADVLRYAGGSGATGTAIFLSMNLASATGSFLINGTAITTMTEVTAMTVFNGGLVVALRRVGGTNGAEVISLSDGPSTGTTAPNSWTRLGSATGTLTTGGTSAIGNIDSLTVYNGRLYAGTRKGGSQAELYRYEGPAAWTRLYATGTLVNGGTSIDSITNLIQYNDKLIIGTAKQSGGAEVYSYTSILDQSYALKFRASSTLGGGEQNGLTNEASIYFVATASANTISTRAQNGAFIFSHGIVTATGAYDVAEDYPTRDTDLQPGDVIEIDPNEKGYVRRSSVKYSRGLVGIYSEKPGFVLSQAGNTIDGAPTVAVALAGRVLARVSTESGSIKAGDYLTSSSIPGVAMKASKAGNVIGKAMEPFDSIQGQNRVGKILVYVSTSQSLGSEIEGLGGLEMSEGDSMSAARTFLTLNRINSEPVKEHAVSNIFTDRLFAGVEVVSPKVIARSLATDTLQGLSGDNLSAILGENGKFTFGTSTVSAGISFDSHGNAHFAGTLRADKIIANQIEGIEVISSSVISISDKLDSSSTEFIGKLSALEKNQEEFITNMASVSARLDKLGSVNLLGMASQHNDGDYLTAVDNIAVYGTSTLSDVSVLNSLTVGAGSTMTIGSHSIDTVGEDFSIQALKQGAVAFLGGLIRFETDGTAVFSENVSFKKNVSVIGVLSATTVSATDLLLGQGDATVISDTEVESSAAAGLVTIKKDNDHVKIINPLVKQNSYIFITPKSATSRTLYLLEQKEGQDDLKGYFIVGIDRATNDDIKFNYLVVN
jgi:hypothetical protein